MINYLIEENNLPLYGLVDWNPYRLKILSIIQMQIKIKIS